MEEEKNEIKTENIYSNLNYTVNFIYETNISIIIQRKRLDCNLKKKKRWKSYKNGKFKSVKNVICWCKLVSFYCVGWNFWIELKWAKVCTAKIIYICLIEFASRLSLISIVWYTHSFVLLYYHLFYLYKFQNIWIKSVHLFIRIIIYYYFKNTLCSTTSVRNTLRSERSREEETKRADGWKYLLSAAQNYNNTLFKCTCIQSVQEGGKKTVVRKTN